MAQQLPPGFVLDRKPQAAPQTRAALPPGFVLDRPQAATPAPRPGDPTVFKRAPAEMPLTAGEYAEDALKSFGVGAAKGVIGLAGLPGDIREGTRGVANWISQQFGASPEMARQIADGLINAGAIALPGSQYLPTSGDVTGAVKQAEHALTGSDTSVLDRQPRSTLGEYSQTFGEYASGAVAGPGGIGRKVVMTAVPALLSETAGQITKGTEAEPYARAIFGLAGGLASAGGGGSVTKIAAKGAPTREVVKAGADALYDQLRAAGIKYDANSYELMARNLTSKLRQEGFRPKTTKEAADTLDYIFEHVGTSPDYGDFAALRENAGKLLVSQDKRERMFGSMIVDALDDFAARSPLMTNGSVPANEVAPLMKEARGLAQRNIKARKVEEAIENARNAASGFENGLRIEFRKILADPKKRAGFTPTEIEAFKEIVRGTSAQNLAAQFGRLGIGVGTKTAKAAFLPALVGGGGAAAIDPFVGGATVAVASGVKHLAAKNAERIADRTMKTVLAGKDAQRAALQAKRAEQVKAGLRRALGMESATVDLRASDSGTGVAPAGNQLVNYGAKGDMKPGDRRRPLEITINGTPDMVMVQDANGNWVRNPNHP